MTKKRKVCIVIASRANFARIRSTALILNQYENVEVEIIAAGSALLYKYGKVVEQIEELFPKVYRASFIIEGDTPTEMAKSTGLAIIELSNIFDYSRPDIVLTIADRYETIATAIAASYMNIPLAHTQGGELTGSIDESVRHSITKLAHLHFPSTKAARKNLIQMGESSENIILSGCPSIDLALEAEKNFDPDLDLFHLYGGSGHKLEWEKEFLVVLQHPVTTSYESTLKQIEETVKAVIDQKMQVAWLWPNVDAGSDIISKRLREIKNTSEYKIRFFRNFNPEHYIQLLIKSNLLIGNSSSGIRECSALGIPNINIGDRQNKRQRGKNTFDCIHDEDEIKKGIEKQLNMKRYERSNIYGDGKSSEIISKSLSSHKFSIKKEFQEIKF